MNSKQEWQEGAPKLQQVGPTTCAYCTATFPSIDALRAHKAKKLKEENHPDREAVHLWCEICDIDFHTLGGVGEHLRQFHAHKQDFSCPGCDVKFVTLSSFVKHVELGQCCQLDIEKLQARFASKLSFAKGLARLDRASRQDVPNIKPKDFSMHLGQDAEPEAPWQESANLLSAWEGRDTNAWGSSEPVGLDDGTFPRMAHREYMHGSTKAPDILTGDQSNPLDGKYEENDWASDRNLFPNAAPAQKPTADQLQTLNDNQQAAVERARSLNSETFDPSSPYFDPQKCWHNILRKYKCPHQATCKKTFNKKDALIQHLKSATHSSNKLRCPSCLDRFDTVYALTAHVESQSRKCAMRHALSEYDMYRIFLDQLTWGMAEVGGVHNDFTQKFEFQEEFKQLYGTQKTSGPTFGHKQIHGTNGRGNSARTGRPGLTEATLSKQQQQIRRRGPPSTPYGQNDSGRGDSGPGVALTADALSQLQLQEKHASPWSQHSGSRQQQQRQQPEQQQHKNRQQPAGAWGQSSEPQQQTSGYVWGQLTAMGWDTWDQRPELLQEQKDSVANAEPLGSGWRPQRKGGGSSCSRW
ncbi:hypothetical protein N8I77_009097 [Diaporthe amygdali]|uniref:C2H2-type domain-containing protein n=1 Tax=Phomopsis amygdali TaxID=1214568 RepID=A0AAD9S9F3_PHOAM|nr:hypothetical protein N8I77_009097 [Diaporthe amygdali]